MIRSTQAARLAARQTLRTRAVARPARSYATKPHPPPPAGQPAPNPTQNAKSGDSTTLYLLLGGTAVGIGAWYYMQENPERVEQKGAQAIDAAASKAEGYAKTVEAIGKDKYNQLKAAGENQLADARVRARAEDAHARDYIGEAQDKAAQSYSSAKDYAAQQSAAAQRAITDTRDSAAHKIGAAKDKVEGAYDDARKEVRSQYAHARAEAELKYDDAKARAEAKYGEAKGAAQDTAQEAKKGWFSWLGWGKSKANEAEEAALREKDAAKRSLAGAVADKAEATRQWAEGKKRET